MFKIDNRQAPEQLSVHEYDNLTVLHPQCFLLADGEYICDERVYPAFGTKLRSSSIDMSPYELLPESYVPGRTLVFQNWGNRIWGHFLIFMLPRLLIARQSGIDLTRTQILMSTLSPEWQKKIISELFGISDEQVYYFDPRTEKIKLEHAITPQLPLNGENFHAPAWQVFRDLRTLIVGEDIQPTEQNVELLLIDRRPFIEQSASTRRSSVNFPELVRSLQRLTENMLVVDPASLPLIDQVKLFMRADIVVGEYGSALHNAVFGESNLSVVSIGALNSLQSQICRMMRQQHVAIEANISGQYQIPLDSVTECVSQIINSRKLNTQHGVIKLNPSIHTDQTSAVAETTRPPTQAEITSERINAIGSLVGAKRYLEVGVWRGETFRRVNIHYKCGVDPRPLFDLGDLSLPHRFYTMPSDSFFINENEETFDVIFLDGLHTFEQTFRDFVNSLTFSHDKTVWIIDDTVPSDFCSAMADASRASRIRSLTNDKSLAWHGDVFKLLFTIHDFFPKFDYRTVIGRGNPQTILVKSNRKMFSPRWNSFETVSRFSFAEFIENREVIKPVSDKEAIMWLTSLLRAGVMDTGAERNRLQGDAP